MYVYCSSRDSLDAVAAALAHSGGYNLALLHSDLEEHEIQQQLVQLKRAVQTLPQLPEGGHPALIGL
jgi:superfamily II DNA helicase RecQ